MFKIVGPNGEPGGGLVVILIVAAMSTIGFFIVMSQAFSSAGVV